MSTFIAERTPHMNGVRPSTQRAHQLEMERFKEEALQLYNCGLSYRTVAERISFMYDPSGAQKVSHMWVKRVVDRTLRALQAQQQHTVEEWRMRELAKLDAYAEAIARKVDSGDTKAIDTAIKLMDRRAKYLGLDAPVRAEVDTTVRYEIVGINVLALQ